MMLEEGTTCWRRASASRAALLVDGAAYFAALRAALEKARERVWILGWDIRSEVSLDPLGSAEPLGRFLDRLVRERPELEICILIWDWALPYSMDRELFPQWSLGLLTHPRVRFELDAEHPLGGCQHEKLVVIDGSLVFCGGIDLTAGRWDTPAHRLDEPTRALPADKPMPPFHDVEIMAEGEVAAAAEELARERWLRVTGEDLAAARPRGSECWPDAVEPWWHEVAVGIGRTRPDWNGMGPAHEIAAFYEAMAGAAQRYIYIENQYLTVESLARRLAERLLEPDGPEIVILTPERCEGVVETAVMDVGRARFVQIMREADRFDRLRIMAPKVHGEAINLHAKLIVVDDRWFSAGSANLANRSMGLDTEINLIIEAGPEENEPRVAIGRVRDTLLAEHLGCEPAGLQAAVAERGSLVRALDALNGQTPRSLVRLEPDPSNLLAEASDPILLADSPEPLTVERVAERLAPPPRRRRIGRRLLAVMGLLAVVIALAFLLGNGALDQEGLVRHVLAVAHAHRGSGIDLLIVLAVFAAGSVVMVPVTLLILATAMLFGPWLGVAYALGGVAVGTASSFMLGRFLGRDVVRRVGGRRVNALRKRLSRHGLLTAALVRMVPVAPFGVVNMVAGVTEIGAGTFVLGSVLGMFPGILLMSLLGDRIGAWLRHPVPGNLVILGLCAVLVGLVAWLATRWLQRARPAAG
ncbi:VTT domain-containing protein [Marinimicrococcus flavescens]|uniref:Phospholipase D n=1 Tax=Marinimicrococcus flavescens TaxID=3031815 RepID=A0AAP3V152_9PROT|nr:VTT domain-containing protein [Marinimicrococcus flavescens]